MEIDSSVMGFFLPFSSVSISKSLVHTHPVHFNHHFNAGKKNEEKKKRKPKCHRRLIPKRWFKLYALSNTLPTSDSSKKKKKKLQQTRPETH